MILSGLLFSASIVAFAASPSLVLGVVLSIVAGVSATVFGTIIATFIQAATPNELRGRVMSLYFITLIGLPALGSLGSGASAEWLGGPGGAPRAVVVGAAILGIVLVLVAPFFWQRAVQRSAAASKRG